MIFGRLKQFAIDNVVSNSLVVAHNENFCRRRADRGPRICPPPAAAPCCEHRPRLTANDGLKKKKKKGLTARLSLNVIAAAASSLHRAPAAMFTQITLTDGRGGRWRR